MGFTLKFGAKIDWFGTGSLPSAQRLWLGGRYRGRYGIFTNWNVVELVLDRHSSMGLFSDRSN